MKYIDENVLAAFEQGVERATGREIQVYEIGTFEEKRKGRVTFGLNWASLGTQDTKTTKTFAARLIYLANIVDWLNDMHLTTANFDMIQSSEEMTQTTHFFKSAVECYLVPDIKDALAKAIKDKDIIAKFEYNGHTFEMTQG